MRTYIRILLRVGWFGRALGMQHRRCDLVQYDASEGGLKDR